MIRLDPDFRKRVDAEGRLQQMLDRCAALEARGLKPAQVRAFIEEEFAPVPKAAAGVEAPSPASPGQPQPAAGPTEQDLSAHLDDLASTRDMRAVILWVFDNMDIEHVQPMAAPSKGAWSLLQACRTSKKLKEEFFLTLMPKLIPNKSQLGDDDGQDDIADLHELCDRVSAAARLAKGEDVA